MNEQEEKAIKWMKNVRDDAVVTLYHIAKNEPNVSPMLYVGRKEKAEVIIAGFEELEQYRALGTVEELQEAREKQIPKKPIWEQGVCYAMTKDGKERYEMIPKCPSCLSRELIYSYPCKCGQKLDFS